MVSPAHDGLPDQPDPPPSQGPSSTPDAAEKTDKEALNRPAPPLTLSVSRSAQQYLRDLFAGIVEHVLPDRAHINEPAAHNHITLLLTMNLRGDRLQECLELGDAEMRSTGHRYRAAHHLTLILQCCNEMEGHSNMSQPLADLYITLADHLLFMKGMFNAPDIDKFLDLNATKLPGPVRSLTDVGEFAYHRASQLVLDQNDTPQAEKRSRVLEYLGDHVPACIMGLRYVRQELDALPFELRSHNPLLVFQSSVETRS